MQLVKYVFRREGKELIECPERTEVIAELPDDPRLEEVRTEILLEGFLKWKAEQNKSH